MKYSTRRARGGLTILVIAVSILLVILSAAIIYTRFLASENTDSEAVGESKKDVVSAWSEGDIEKTLALSRAGLARNPLEPFYLSFNGIGTYYASLDIPEGDEKQVLLDESVFSLRKALALGKNLPVKAQVEYVLGKAYYQKGEPWYDLAVSHLENSIQEGYLGKDTEQYLALVYVGLEQHDIAVIHFEKALELGESDVLMLSAALSYKELGDNEKASSYLERAIAEATDDVVTQKARFMMAEMAAESGAYAEAGLLYEDILKTDPRSAEAWFLLGTMYELQKDPIRARAAWRKATSIDPNHIEARKKLLEKL